MADEKEKQDFKNAAQYGTEAGAARVPADVLFRVGPQFDDETWKAARKAFNPAPFLYASLALAGAPSLAESVAKSIHASIEQLQGVWAFDARAIVEAAMADVRAQYPQPSFAGFIADFIKAAQANATCNPPVAAAVMAQTMRAQADVIGRSVSNWTLRKDESWAREEEPQKIQELGEVG